MSPVGDRPASGGGDFWSRRKARVAAEEAEAKAAEAEAEAASARTALEEKTDEEILAELDLKDPDTLEPGDDFTAFLRSEVPERLRRRALRRLWRSNAVLANLDSLVDYGEDYTDSARVVENMQTAYRVGKGMLSHILKDETDSAEAVSPEGVEEPAPDGIPEGGAPAAVRETAEPEDNRDTADIDTEDSIVASAAAREPAREVDAMPHTSRSPRRMKFSYT